MEGDSKMTEKKGWKDLMRGADLPPASSLEYKTGSWRTSRPVWDPDKCTHCMFCVAYCPDMAISIVKSEEGVKGFNGRIYKGTVRLETDLDFCKGCGICVHECPTHAIEMIREEEATSSK